MSDMILCPKCGEKIEVSAALEQEVTNRLAPQRQKFIEEGMQKARGEMGPELQDLRSRLRHAEQAELAIRRERARLENEKAALELNVARRVDEGKALVREQAKQQFVEERRFEDAQKDQKIEALLRKISELEQVADRGAPGDIGEAAETTLEEDLRREFPHDKITPVATDGDVIQEVRDGSGHLCGSVLWESKRTTKWQEPWLAKAKKDRQNRSADVAVIVTVAMPKEVSTLGCKDGVWIANHYCFIGAAKLLRHGIMEVARSKRAGETKQTKSQQLHGYLHSTEFRQQVEGILDPLVAMKKALGTEKRSHEKAWKAREHQLDQAERNAAEMYGSLDGILGGTLPEIPHLEFSPTVPEEADDAQAANGIPAKKGAALVKAAG